MNILKGSTDITTYVNLVDSAAGTPETGLTITNIDATYTRNRSAAVKNDLTALAAVDSAHADNKGIEVDATNAPGIYRIDWPDAAFASGVDKVVLTVTCSGCAPASVVVQLVNYNPEDGTRLGLTALPNAAADAAGGLPISDAGGLDLDAQIGTKINDILTDTGTTLQGELDGIQADTEDIQSRLPTALTGDGNIKADILKIEGADPTDTIQTEVEDALAVYGAATGSQVTGLNVNTRCNLLVPAQIETPDSSTQVYKVRLHLFDEVGNMEAPDSTPTVTLVNQSGTDRSSRLSAASNPSTGVYTWDYTATAGDAEEQLIWVFTVVEGGVTRTYPASSYVVEYTSYRFDSSDRTKLNAIHAKLPSKSYFTGSNNSDGDVQMDEATGNFAGSVASVAGAVGSVTGNVGGNVAGSVGSVASGGISASSFAAGAIDAAAIATDAITSAELSATAISEIQSGLSTLTAADIRTAVGLASANLDTQLTAIDDYLDTEVAAIKAKTDNLPGDPADASDIASAFSTVNSTLATIAAYIDTEVAAIKAKTDNLPAAPAATGDAMTLTGGERSTLAAAILDLAAGIETGMTLRQAMRLMSAVLLGKSTNGGKTYRDVNDTKDRVTGTMDGSNNRTAVTLDAA